MTLKFSGFDSGGTIEITDTLVGLRGDINTRFNAANIGTAKSVNNVTPDGDGNIALLSSNIPDFNATALSANGYTSPFQIVNYTGSTGGAIVAPISFSAIIFNGRYVFLFIPPVVGTIVATQTIFLNPGLPAPLRITNTTSIRRSFALINNFQNTAGTVQLYSTGIFSIATDANSGAFNSGDIRTGFSGQLVAYDLLATV